jgi:hypothetical protein
VRACLPDPFLDPQNTVLRQVGFDFIWERRY